MNVRTTFGQVGDVVEDQYSEQGLANIVQIRSIYAIVDAGAVEQSYVPDTRIPNAIAMAAVRNGVVMDVSIIPTIDVRGAEKKGN